MFKVTEDIIYVGVNDHEVDLFEGQYVVENGMSYDEAMQECGKCLRCDHFGCGVVEGGRV